MNRLARTTAVVATALAVACLPATALADTPRSAAAPISFNNATTSIVSGDVFGAGHSNIVGSGDGTAPGLDSGVGVGAGAGAAAPRVVTLETDASLPYPPAELVRSEGAEYPYVLLMPNIRATILVSGESFADYRYPSGGTFHIELGIDAGGRTTVACRSEGAPQLVCVAGLRGENTVLITRG
ncbi:hypothetical protein GXW83_08555 [Streptacidiphilus sp. PB12-B1b]|uniref:hypothetical protein n=1 Tax=Streptacidiphilus sp. PB12-B1b TaxID=2705012 RepID=UPI0015FA9731|nr:hypothetical protein [Streptacidiphilus sp. PB12-B1b]QMU75782.1 hypothetical protein GXW83_08555 [Streptacidiphilus sp. PB12-B1b]